MDHARRALALDAPRGCGHSLAQDKGLCPWLAAASPPRAIAIATQGGRCGGDLLGGPALRLVSKLGRRRTGFFDPFLAKPEGDGPRRVHVNLGHADEPRRAADVNEESAS